MKQASPNEFLQRPKRMRKVATVPQIFLASGSASRKVRREDVTHNQPMERTPPCLALRRRPSARYSDLQHYLVACYLGS